MSNRYLIVDNDNYKRTVFLIGDGDAHALDRAASSLKTCNIRIISKQELSPFEKWAWYKNGMLIDYDENNQYKSPETRAAFETWQQAQKEAVYLMKTLLPEVRMIIKRKLHIRKDFTLINAMAGCDNFVYNHMESQTHEEK